MSLLENPYWLYPVASAITPVVVQSTGLQTMSGAASNLTFTLSNVTAGNSLIIVVGSYTSGATAPITYPAGWSQFSAFTSDGTHQQSCIYTIKNEVAGQNSATLSGNGYFAGAMLEVAHITGLSTSGSAVAAAAATSISVSTAASTVGQNSLIICGLGYSDNTTGTLSATAPAGLVLDYSETDASSIEPSISGHLIQTSAGVETLTWSSLTDNTNGVVAIIAAFTAG